MKRPLAIVALLYAGGLLVGDVFKLPLLLLFSLALTITALCLLTGRLRRFLLWPLIVLTGWTNLAWRTAVISPHDLRALLKNAPAAVVVRGRLCDTPSERVSMRGEMEASRTLAELSVTQIRRGPDSEPAHGRIVVTTPGTLPEGYYAGQEVEISGVIAPPPEPLAEGLFDYRSYLRRQGIYYQLKADSASDWSLLSANRAPPLSDRFVVWAKATLARGLPNKDEPLRLLEAMSLGLKSELPKEMYQPFVLSGTMHIFAVSGLHVALIAGILVGVLRVLQVGRIGCGATVVPLLWFYTAATGWQPSAIRSTVMMSIIIGGWALRRPTDLLNSLAAAAFVILLWEPRQLFQASFQLSFFVVLSIALLVPPLKRVIDRGLADDPLLPHELLPRWRRASNTALRWLALSFTTSSAAWLGSLPLTAHYFHLFCPVTLLANLLIVPLAGATLASTMGGLICGAWFPWVSELFNHGAWFWMSLMMRISAWATTLPGAYRYVPSPPAWSYVAYYVFLTRALSGWMLKRQVRRWALAAAAFVLAFGVWEWREARREFQLTVIPLNGGHTVYVDGAGTRNDWLVDCGSSNSVEFVTEPFLHAHGVNRLPRLALTHGDLQHVGGTPLLREAFRVRRVFTSPVRFRSIVYRRIVHTLDASPALHQTVSRGDAAGCWTVLHPGPTDSFPQADDASLVLRGNFLGTRILLLGDLGRPGQEALMRRSPDLRADIVITGLPEHGEALCNALLDAVQPKLIVVADSEFPATKRASVALRERLERRQVPVLFTRSAGAVTLSCERNRWEATAMDGFFLAVTAAPQD